MRRLFALLLWAGLAFLGPQRLAAQPVAPVRVLVYPGTELLQVIHLLSDTAQLAQSTYNAEVARYFAPYKRHPAVLAARHLSRRISCDFPVRLSWAFYDFPNVKLATMRPEHMDGYETVMPLAEVQAYFQQCVAFYHDAHFWEFYQAHAAQRAGWVRAFEQGMKQQQLLETIQQFYRLPRQKPVALTLGVLNCSSYAMQSMRGINPNLPDQYTIMVSYHQLMQGEDSLAKAPQFQPTAFTSQLVWHELGHVYLAPVFARHQAEVNQLAYLAQQDPRAKRWSEARGSWANFLNENVTQAATSLLRVRTGKATRAEALEPDDFYIYYPELAEIIEREYYQNQRYKNFDEFFPVLLQEFGRKHPAVAGK
ncbi:DUF4932 domain-containing protein [Hymenobacter sp. RP-2-7]|uniref:DUF4932 domain-containing protein n=1 Tax=Hymenobacter polaris TaxID=2682546 RepID=A0A7Y0AI50_9BACT|nr:DUF4932 domain-containing protein [Hymenobacter polaris]NML67735.1 DUF4932 domain-containing protein [Hymenobacter polaris]